MMNFSRRELLRTASAGAALTAISPGLKVAFAADAAPVKDTLIVLFLRFGSDGMQMIAPAGDPNYIANRPTIRVRTDGNTPGLGVGTMQGTDFFLHPATTDLKALFDQKKLAIVHAAGLKTTERSHFEVQERMELGANLNEKQPSDGWLARHVKTLAGTRPALSTIALSSNNPESLLGFSNSLAIANTNTFAVSGGDPNANVIRALNSGKSSYDVNALETLNAITTVQTGLRNLTVDPLSTTYGYPGGALTNSLRSLASLLKMGVGLEVAHIDMGGWDHHANLNVDFNSRASDLSRSLGAFWKEIAAFQDKVTLVTMTEFGRRFRENANGGTDHGSGGYMFVLGGNVNGGRMYGTWPGLAANQLFNGDLDITTDYRRVLGEILVQRQGATKLDQVFPTVPYNPMGIVNSLAASVTATPTLTNATPGSAT